MKSFAKFLKMTLAGGVLFLVPLVVIAVVLGKAFKVAQTLVHPLVVDMPIHSLVGIGIAKIVAILSLMLLCFLAGLFARTGIAKKIVSKLETNVLSNLPGYEFVKGVGEGLLHVEDQHTSAVALARIEDAWQLAFLIERIETGHLAVYVPGAPYTNSGSVYFLTEDRVKLINLPAQDALKCLRRLGGGSDALLKELLPPPERPTAVNL